MTERKVAVGRIGGLVVVMLAVNRVIKPLPVVASATATQIPLPYAISTHWELFGVDKIALHRAPSSEYMNLLREGEAVDVDATAMNTPFPYETDCQFMVFA